MSTAIFEDIADAYADANNALRETFALDNVRCFLLKRGEHTSAFTSLGELTSGYRVKFDDNRSESGLFRHSTTTAAAMATFRDVWAQASHIAYGVGASIEVFQFAETETGPEKDSIDPDGSSVYWSGRIVKIPNERYTIPVVEP